MSLFGEENFKKWFIKQLRRVDLGKDKIFIRFITPLQFGMILFTWLSVNMNINLTLIQMGEICFGLAAAVYVLGYIWDKTHLWSEELEFDNKRNPVMIELRNHMDKIEKKLDELSEARK